MDLLGEYYGLYWVLSDFSGSVGEYYGLSWALLVLWVSIMGCRGHSWFCGCILWAVVGTLTLVAGGVRGGTVVRGAAPLRAAAAGAARPLVARRGHLLPRRQTHTHTHCCQSCHQQPHPLTRLSRHESITAEGPIRLSRHESITAGGPISRYSFLAQTGGHFV